MEFYTKKVGWFLSGVHLHKNTVSHTKRGSVLGLHGKRKGRFLKKKKRVIFHKGEPPSTAVIMTIGWVFSLFFFFLFSSTEG